MDRIGPYVSLPNIPSPNGIVHQHHDQPHATVEVTEFKCGPPFATNNNGNNDRNQRPIPLVNDEQNLLGSSYHKLELNFLFAGQKK